MEVTLFLLVIAVILFFGFMSEVMFKKTKIPDVLFLILLGIVMGPFGLNYVRPEQLEGFAPVFTTFALLFLLYEGAFNINLASFAKGVTKSIVVTTVNFIASVAVIAGIMMLAGYELMTSILTGFVLGGLSSAFVIPILKSLNIRSEAYSILTLESAFTDVLCIVMSLTMLELINIQAFSVKAILGSIVSLFAVATLIGIVAGILWIILVSRFFKETKPYMVSIAYVILVYVATEFLGGNGAIATLMLGLMLRNSKQLTQVFGEIMKERSAKKSEKEEENEGIRATSNEEEFFNAEISFFLKVFFFVYIGIMIKFSDVRFLIIGAGIAIALLLVRFVSYLTTRKLRSPDRKLIAAVFARGLAAAAIAQLLFMRGFEQAADISGITYSVVFFTMVLSSARIFFLERSKDAA